MTVAISPKSIQVSWSEVEAIDQNGMIVEYVVEYTQTMFPSIPTTQSKRVSTTTATLIDLQEYVEYSIRVRASTVIGPGPYSQPVNQRTLEDGNHKPCTYPKMFSLSSCSTCFTSKQHLCRCCIINFYQSELVRCPSHRPERSNLRV